MIRALLDTNVILDVLLAREPMGARVAQIWQAHEEEHFTGFICAITPATVYYVARRLLGKQQALKMTGDLADTFEVCAVNRQILRAALQLDLSDFEDAIQAASAAAENLDFIITSNLKDFKKSPVRAVSPVEFLKQLG